MSHFKFNKIYVLESLDKHKEPLTGKELYDDIIRWKVYLYENITVEYKTIRTKLEFQNELENIKNECESSGIYPILHLEIHGNSKGIELYSHEFMPWEELYNYLRSINKSSKCNLFLTMAICHGAYIMQEIKPYRESPFWGIIGSFEELDSSDLLISYSSFYNEFLVNMNLAKAVENLQNANPSLNTSYRFINSEEVFINVYKKYLKEQFSREAINRRADESLFEVRETVKKKKDKENFRKEFIRKLYKERKSTFEEHKNIFFMINDFGENIERFKITFKEIKKD